MKTWNLFVLAAAVLAFLAGPAAAQVDVKPGGTVVVPGTTLPGQPQTTVPGTSGTVQGTVPGGVVTQGYSTYPGTYYQGYQVIPSGTATAAPTTYSTGRFGLRRYSYYTPVAPMPQATAEGTATAAVASGTVQATPMMMPSGTTYNTGRFGMRRYSYYTPAAPMAPVPATADAGCCGAAPMPMQPVAYGGDCGCQTRKRGLFRRG